MTKKPDSIKKSKTEIFQKKILERAIKQGLVSIMNKGEIGKITLITSINNKGLTLKMRGLAMIKGNYMST